MKRLIIAGAAAIALSSTAFADLKVGDTAPDFTAAATKGGDTFTFSLADALKKGPVVLYFYPAAFTKGCTVEAHEFADATEEYAKLGATVIGVSEDGIDTLKKFSTQECRSKFPVASDADQKIMKAYDAVLPIKPQYSNRTSYVISPDDKVIYAYTALDPEGHVKNTLDAVKTWKASH